MRCQGGDITWKGNQSVDSTFEFFKARVAGLDIFMH